MPFILFMLISRAICACISAQDRYRAPGQGRPKDLDVLEWMGRTALELVGQGMMGYSFDPLVEEVHNDFAEAVKSFVCASCSVAVVILYEPR